MEGTEKTVAEQEEEQDLEIKRHGPVLNDHYTTSYEWRHKDGRQIIVSLKRKGLFIRGHYHTGEDPSKKPERIFIAQGEVKAIVVFPDKNIVQQVLKTGDSISIWPYVWHAFEILEDAVIIEYRSNYFDPKKPDTHRQ